MSVAYPDALRSPALDPEVRAAVDLAVARLRDGVLERDDARGAPHLEVDVLRTTGLLAGPWSGAVDHPLQRWDQTLAAISAIASVDPSAASLLGYHHMHLLLVTGSGNPEIAAWAARETVANRWIWGGANNPSGEKVTVDTTADGYRLNGTKEFATGSLVADQLVIQEAAPAEGSPLRRIVLAVDARSPGLSVLDDWDWIGVVRSATNRIAFRDVFVPKARFVKFGRLGNESAAALEASQPPGFQILFANVYLGITLGALRTAYSELHNGPSGTKGRRAFLGHVQEIFGELAVTLAGATAAVESVNRHFADVVGGPSPASEAAIRQLSARTFAAKLVAHQAVLETTQRVFEITGSRGAMRRCGLEKFWRDARNHSLHDELRVRYRLVGATLLDLEPA